MENDIMYLQCSENSNIIPTKDDTLCNYAHVIKSVEKFIVKNFSQDDWIKIINVCGFASNEDLHLKLLDEELFNHLTQNACKLLDLTINELMEQAGRSLFDHYMESGYASIMTNVGPDLPTFLSGLDHLHEHFNFRYPGMRPPSFRVVHDPKCKNSFLVHYYSERVGLDYYVIGLLKASSEIIYNHSVDVTVKQHALRHNESTIFEVKLPDHITSSKQKMNGASFETDLATDIESVIDQNTFCGTFPFHLLLDKNLQIIQAGIALGRLVPNLKLGSSNFLDLFNVVRPHIEITFKGILSHINSVYHVETRHSIGKKPLLSPDNSLDDIEDNKEENDGTLRLKGQMMYLEESGTMMYFASPRIYTLDGLSEKGLYLSDIPIHDATRDLILLFEQSNAEVELGEKLKDLQDQLQKTSNELEYEQKLADRLLYSILPPSVADDLRAKKPVAAMKYDLVTIMFSGIADFASLCNHSTDAMEIVKTLNSIYIHFDGVSDKYSEVYKVETVGDKYMCVSGLPDESESHAHNIAHLAIDMMKISKQVTVGDKNIIITIGIHSGEVVAGVIGRRLPRYCLFGNVVNLTSRTETTGMKGKINITEVVYNILQKNPDEAFIFEYRGPVTMKGKKEPMLCYYLSENVNRQKDSCIKTVKINQD